MRTNSKVERADVNYSTIHLKLHKGNKFGDCSYCPLNRGCPLNTVPLKVARLDFFGGDTSHISLSINYVGMSKDTGKRLLKLHYNI